MQKSIIQSAHSLRVITIDALYEVIIDLIIQNSAKVPQGFLFDFHNGFFKLIFS